MESLGGSRFILSDSLWSGLLSGMQLSTVIHSALLRGKLPLRLTSNLKSVVMGYAIELVSLGSCRLGRLRDSCVIASEIYGILSNLIG